MEAHEATGLKVEDSIAPKPKNLWLLTFKIWIEYSNFYTMAIFMTRVKINSILFFHQFRPLQLYTILLPQCQNTPISPDSNIKDKVLFREIFLLQGLLHTYKRRQRGCFHEDSNLNPFKSKAISLFIPIIYILFCSYHLIFHSRHKTHS